MPQFDLDSIDRLLSTTKAVRRRLDLTRPVPRDVVADCIRLGCYAPNASNAQEWFWVVVDDADQRRKVAQIYRDVLVPRVSQMLDAKLAMGDEAGARISRSILYLADCMHEVPVLVIPCYDVGSALHRYKTMIPEPGPLGLSTHMDSGMFASIIPAVWSFQLALRSRGLGSALTTAHQLAHLAMAEVLGIPSSWFQVALIPVAYTKGDDFAPSPRRPVDEIIIWNRAEGVR
ncbi:MAG: nitroreductase family protein [Actinobacteria bacterium]|nr:MAG: nitroreductase family protein [Actinomycetota bacterium]